MVVVGLTDRPLPRSHCDPGGSRLPHGYSEVFRAPPPHGSPGGLTTTPERPYNSSGGSQYHPTTTGTLRASPPQTNPRFLKAAPHQRLTSQPPPLPYTHTPVLRSTEQSHSDPETFHSPSVAIFSFSRPLHSTGGSAASPPWQSPGAQYHPTAISRRSELPHSNPGVLEATPRRSQGAQCHPTAALRRPRGPHNHPTPILRNSMPPRS